MSTVVNDIRFLHRASLRQFYQNSKNSIEDPIFTGFTMEIDKLHSPLFFALAGDEYTKAETLRSADGVDTELANKIEDKLNYVNKIAITGFPDSYEISTIQAKDKFGSSNGRRPGYGLWEKYYLDNVLYGAADYIYMVDKVTDGAYTDDYGVTDLGNGTPSVGVYDHYNDLLNNPELAVHSDAVNGKINDMTSNQDTDIFFENDRTVILPEEQLKLDNFIKFLKANPDCKVQINGYASKDNATYEHNMDLSENRAKNTMEELIKAGIDASRIVTGFFGDTVQPFTGIKNRAATCRVIGEYTPESALQRKIDDAGLFSEKDKKDHEDNLKLVKTTKALYDNLKDKYENLQGELKKLSAQIDNEKYETKKELAEYQDRMRNYESKLKTLVDGDAIKKYITDIDNTYAEFQKYVNFFNNEKDSENTYANPQKNYSEFYEHITAHVDVATDEVINNEFNSLSENEKTAYSDSFKKIFEVTKSQLNSPLSKVQDSKIKPLKEEIEKISKELFGVHPDKRLGTEGDPAPGSKCFDYQQAKDKSRNDNYSQQENLLNELKDVQANYNDLQEFNKYKATKDTVERALPTIDYEMSPAEKENPTLYNERINTARNSRAKYEVPQTVYDMMGFIRGMDDLIHKYPYAMQSITGLDEAYKKYFDLKDPYMGSGDGKITISCLDYLDMRVSSMFNKYFNAVYDRQYRRERVPINLRRFQCSIFVHDIRNFKDTIYTEDVKNSGDLSLITEIALNYLSAIEFKFYDCEIVPEETGGIFDNVTNITGGDMRGTNFTFTYGNCVINFLPFEDLRKYILANKENKDLKPKITPDEYMSDNFSEDYIKLNETSIINDRLARNNITNDYDGRYSAQNPSGADLAGNFRRWFDRSELGNVNNNDYREYIRHDSAVAVDDHYKTSIVNNFALGSVAQKNQELTAMDDALRRLVVGISASTGIPVKGVTDALNIQFIDPIINEKDLATPVLKNIGNVNNSTIKDEKRTEYVGTVITDEQKDPDIVQDLGNVNKS